MEFFIAGTHTGETKTWYSFSNDTKPAQLWTPIPSVQYKKAPIFFLLFPEKKYPNNVPVFNEIWRFEGNRIGDLTVTEPWNINEIIALYRAEYARSDDVQLIIDRHHRYRLMDYVEGTLPGWTGGVTGYDNFYGFIEAGEELRGSETLWLLATPLMFAERFEIGPLR